MTLQGIRNKIKKGFNSEFENSLFSHFLFLGLFYIGISTVTRYNNKETRIKEKERERERERGRDKEKERKNVSRHERTKQVKIQQE